MKRDPDKDLKGVYTAEVRSRGLRLVQGDDRFRIPVGTPAKHQGSRVVLDLDGRDVTFEVRGLTDVGWLRCNRYRLAADLAAFLNGRRTRPLRSAEYVLPWYLFAAAAAPLGIPIITLGGALPVLVGVLLSAACYAIVQRESWSLFARLGLSWGITGISYAVAFTLLLLATGKMPTGLGGRGGVQYGGHNRSTIPPRDWQTYRSTEGHFEVLLPGKPEMLTEPYPGVQVSRSREETTFRLHYFPLAADRQINLNAPDGVGLARKQWHELTELAIREYPESREDASGVVGHSLVLDKQFRLRDKNPKRTKMVRTDCHFQRFVDRVYCATVVSPHAQALEYDVQKFLGSIRITHRPERGK